MADSDRWPMCDLVVFKRAYKPIIITIINDDVCGSIVMKSLQGHLTDNKQSTCLQ